MDTVTIVIPTHQRAGLLPRTLSALTCQSRLPFEVIVVADACTDNTVQVVRAFAAHVPFRLHVVEHEARSAAATRNLGAQHAAGSTVIFIDDDIEALPSLVQAHLSSTSAETVTLGYSKPALPENASQWQLEARIWWEDQYREFRIPGHRFTYRDLSSGNFSIQTNLFHRLGGFDVAFSGRLEDYEFGYRLTQTGTRFRFAADAIGLHHDTTDLPKWLRRIFLEGVADVQMGKRHPELCRSIFGSIGSSGMPSCHGRLLQLPFAMKGKGESIISAGLKVAYWLERIKLRRRRRGVIFWLRRINYWRGVASVFRSLEEFAGWRDEQIDRSVIAFDVPSLEWGAPLAEFDMQRVLAIGSEKGLRILFDGTELLAIPPQIGAEPLTEAHIRRMIKELSADQFVPALAFQRIASAAGGRLC
ncbi:MAG: glycosyl transferase family 2 [Bryobacterales bacterium]|nr:glycosyl transferase family 2 [Bryobacterales bacterium]